MRMTTHVSDHPPTRSILLLIALPAIAIVSLRTYLMSPQVHIVCPDCFSLWAYFLGHTARSSLSIDYEGGACSLGIILLPSLTSIFFPRWMSNYTALHA
jgi:hypothetical protein